MGSTAGGDAVVITGTGFTGDTQVTFDGVASDSIIVVSSTEIIALSPAHGAGATDVTVANAAGACTAAGQFNFDSVQPDAGKPAGGGGQNNGGGAPVNGGGGAPNGDSSFAASAAVFMARVGMNFILGRAPAAENRAAQQVGQQVEQKQGAAPLPPLVQRLRNESGDPVEDMLLNLDIRGRNVPLRDGAIRAFDLETQLLAGKMKVAVLNGAANAGQVVVKILESVPEAGAVAGAAGRALAGQPLDPVENLQRLNETLSDGLADQELVEDINDKIRFVDDAANMDQAARDYESAANGARSNPSTRKPQAPVLDRTLPDGSQRPVKFDGVEGDQLIDRKRRITTFKKAQDQALRQSEALRQGGFRGRWEVPNEVERSRALKMLNDLGITNIDIEVVPEP